MNRYLLMAAGILTFALTIFKIAMPYLFHWQESMGTATPGMWAILYGENLGISILLIFFAYMAIFQGSELVSTAIGRTALLALGALWIYRAVIEILLFKIGVDGAWWRVLLFAILALLNLIPLIITTRTNPDQLKTSC